VGEFQELASERGNRCCCFERHGVIDGQMEMGEGRQEVLKVEVSVLILILILTLMLTTHDV
jgi:hypothetical protein